MGKFTVIPQSTFEEMQLDAGVILKKFTPATPTAPADEDIICPTTGGINISCVPTYSDLGEDVDNCPNNTKELKHLDGWECKMSVTSLGTSPASIKLALGVAGRRPGGWRHGSRLPKKCPVYWRLYSSDDQERQRPGIRGTDWPCVHRRTGHHANGVL